LIGWILICIKIHKFDLFRKTVKVFPFPPSFLLFGLTLLSAQQPKFGNSPGVFLVAARTVLLAQLQTSNKYLSLAHNPEVWRSSLDYSAHHPFNPLQPAFASLAQLQARVRPIWAQRSRPWPGRPAATAFSLACAPGQPRALRHIKLRRLSPLHAPISSPCLTFLREDTAACLPSSQAAGAAEHRCSIRRHGAPSEQGDATRSSKTSSRTHSAAFCHELATRAPPPLKPEPPAAWVQPLFRFWSFPFRPHLGEHPHVLPSISSTSRANQSKP
jgi:hypothetical protein